MASPISPRFAITHLPDLDGVSCPCGTARRAFTDVPGSPASLHLVDIKHDAAAHHHQEHTEIYVVLRGHGHIELDGERFPVQPLTTILIQPGCVHRAIPATDDFQIFNVSLPIFDPADEWEEIPDD